MRLLVFLIVALASVTTWSPKLSVAKGSPMCDLEPGDFDVPDWNCEGDLPDGCVWVVNYDCYAAARDAYQSGMFNIHYDACAIDRDILDRLADLDEA